jgi:hypothetical protein
LRLKGAKPTTKKKKVLGCRRIATLYAAYMMENKLWI